MKDASEEPWTTRWRVERPLDSAGAGMTALVVHTESGQKGVLKRLRPGSHRYTRANMAREIVNLNALESAGCPVPRILDKNTNAYAAKDGVLYFVREYVDGEPLNKDVEAHGPWNLKRVDELVDALTRTLRIAFGLEILHGDLRPDNIVVTKDETTPYIILNYGVTFDRRARPFIVSRENAPRPRFLELPEVLLDQAEPSEITDLTGVVALAYYALTGDVPKTLVAEGGFAPHQRDPEAFANRFAQTKTLVAAQAFFEQGFARRPADRYQTLDEFRACWRRVAPISPLSLDDLDKR